MTKLELALAVQLEQFRAEIGKIPGITGEAAQGMTDRMARELRKQTAAIRTENKQRSALLKQAEREQDEAVKAMEKAGDKLSGGMLGDLKDYAAGFSALGGTLGPIAGLAAAAGVGVTAYASALTAAVTGTVALTREAGEAALRLEELGVASELGISEEMLLNVRDANTGLDALAAVSDAVTVQLADKLAPAVSEVSIVVTAAYLKIESMRKSMEEMTWVTQALYVAANMLTGGGIEQMRLGFESLTNFGSEYREEAEDIVAAVGAAGEKHEEVAKQTAKTWKKPQEDARDYMRALDELWVIINRNQEAQLSGAALIRVQAQNQIEDIERIAAAHEGNLDVEMMAADARVAVNEAAEKKITELMAQEQQQRMEDAAAFGQEQLARLQEYTEAVQSMWVNVRNVIADTALALTDQIAGAIAQEYEKYAQWSAEHAANEEAKLDELQAYKEQHWDTLSKKEREDLNRKIKLQEEETKQAKASADKRAKQSRSAAIAAFVAQRAVAVAQSVVNTILATTAAMAAPPGPPLNTPIVVATGVSGALATAAIAAQPPPAFHLGGMPMGGDGAGDEFAATLRRGEYVVSPRGVAAAGGPANLDALNAGAPASGPTVLHATLMLGDREIGMLKAEITGGRNGKQRDVGYQNQRNTRD